MELKLISKTDKTIEVEFRGEDDTVLNLLKQRLLADDKVENATYIVGHPLLDQPRLHVEVKSGKPEAVVKAAAKDLRQELDAFETQILRGI